MVSCCSRMASAVTEWSTFGWPSRSPPIHEPKRRNDGARQARPGYTVASAASSFRYTLGTTSRSRDSTTPRICRTSSSTIGRAERTELVSQSDSISSAIAATDVSRSNGVGAPYSVRSSFWAIDESFSRTDRRRASLGWAVKTGTTIACARRPASSSASIPRPAIWRSAASAVSARGTSVREDRVRKVRTRACCSARLIRSKNTLKARVSVRKALRSSVLSRSRMRRAAFAEGLARSSFAAARTSSSRLNASSPASRRIALPSRSPSR